MKKVVLALAVLMIATQAMATVTITCKVRECNTPPADYNLVTVGFTSNEPNKVRAFALDIFCTDANIISGSVNRLSQNYDIHPGSFAIVDGNVTGTVVCSSIYPGTEPGPGFKSMTTEQGSLYEKGVDPDPCQVNQALFSFRVDGACTVSVQENAIRGGVVMENPDQVVAVSLPSPVVSLAPPAYGGPDINDWCSLGQPVSWTWLRQCHGDADNADYYLGFSKWAAVGPNDFTLFKAAYRKPLGDPAQNLATDFDHEKYYLGFNKWTRTGPNDFSVLKYYYRKANPFTPGDCQTAEPNHP